MNRLNWEQLRFKAFHFPLLLKGNQAFLKHAIDLEVPLTAFSFTATEILLFKMKTYNQRLEIK